MTNPNKNEFCDNGAILLEDIFETEFFSKDKLDEEIDQVLATSNVSKKLNYSQMKNSNFCLVNHRSGSSDQGMIDVFHPEKNSKQIAQIITRVNHDLNIPQFLHHCTGKDFEYSHSNLYINNSIVNTRGFHVDNFASNSVKLLIYLTDVVSEECGPYSYMLGSHKRSMLSGWFLDRISNYFPKVREFCRSGEQKIFLAIAGCGILSDQSGFHRGMPQTQGKIRKVLVLNYWTK
jgi:hypothetical protein